ncbi:MAG TPA: GNAT family N-acetyltransferase, partial [Polyangiales bacterium]|nr:GNAT family N-acetyltransferase [Polyangiales bacterium]
MWIARADCSLIGRASITLLRGVPELATIGLYVRPAARRGGLGEALAREAVSYAQRQGIRKLEAAAWTPAGHQFCERHSGRQVAGGLWQTLRFERVNWQMIDAWCAISPPGTSLRTIEQLPDELAPEFVALYASVWDDQPFAERAAPAPTLARRREMELRYQQLGFSWLTLLAQESSGALVGLTEVIYDPSQPETVRQVLTGVRPSHRGRGIAKWLKAAMLRAIRARFTRARAIVTGNS